MRDLLSVRMISIAIVAIVCVTVLEIFAINHGINGNGLSISCGVIGATAGAAIGGGVKYKGKNDG